MSTFADKSIRLFRTKSVEDASRLRKKRSSGRLKCFSSNTDNRAWSCSSEERRRHILELLKSYDPNVGNYVPIDLLFKILLNLMTGADDLRDELSKSKQKQRMLEDQKSELSALAKCLSRAGGDLRKENDCLKSEIERLKKKLAELEGKVKKCEQERTQLQNEIENLTGGKGGKGGKDGGKGGRGGSGEDGEFDAAKMKGERDHLRNELDNLRNVQEQLRQAEQRITELMCEIESLQKCLEKAECDALQMVQIIEQQQAKISSLQFCECQLKDITKQRDLLKKQLDCMRKMDSNTSGMQNDCCSEFMNDDYPSLDCQNGENEIEKNKLKCQLKMIEEELRMKDLDIGRLNKKLCKQNDYIKNLKEMLSISEKKSRSQCELQAESSSSETYCGDLEEMLCKMKEMQNKVCKQGQVIMSQRKCLLEQHKYILEQEQIRMNIQCKFKELSKKQLELVDERNRLRNEIMFLSARLKTNLDKIHLLKKTIEQCDTPKPSKCDEEFFNDIPPEFTNDFNPITDKSVSMGSPHFAGGSPSRKGKLSSCGPCSSDRNVDTNPLERYKNFRNHKNQFPSNRSGCPNMLESVSEDTFQSLSIQSSTINDLNLPCESRNDNKNMFMSGGPTGESMSSITFSTDNFNENEMNQFSSCPPDELCDPCESLMPNTGSNLYQFGSSYSPQNSSQFNLMDSTKRSKGIKGCRHT